MNGSSQPLTLIDKGIPIPRPGQGKGTPAGPVRTAMDALAVGESFLAPIISHDPRKTQVYTGRTGQNLKPKKFSTRQIIENGRRVVRVWRVS